MKLILPKLALVCAVLIAGVLYAAVPVRVILIANPSVQNNAIGASVLTDIYTGKKTYWDDGQNIVITVISGQTDMAVKDVSGMDLSQFRTFWQRLVFSGRGQQPRKAEDAAAAVSLVATTLGAIALVPAETPLKGVKLIEIR